MIKWTGIQPDVKHSTELKRFEKRVLNTCLLFNLLLFVYPHKYLEGCKVFTKLVMNSGWNNFAQDKCFSLSNMYYLFFFISLSGSISHSVRKQKQWQVAGSTFGKVKSVM